MRPNISQEIIDHVINSFKPATSGKTKPCRIKVNGQFIATNSKKTMWRNIGFARSALANHFSGSAEFRDLILKHFGDDFYYRQKGSKAILKELEKLKIIEFVEVMQ